MAAVWYLGGADVRSISAAEWASAGVTGVATSVWNATNGWSLPAAGFTAAQLTLLGSLGDFNVAGANGPRPGGVYTTLPDNALVTMGLLRAQLLAAALVIVNYGAVAGTARPTFVLNGVVTPVPLVYWQGNIGVVPTAMFATDFLFQS